MKTKTIRFILSQLTVEPILLLFGYGTFLRSVIFRTFIYDKVCLNYYPSSVCETLDNHTESQDHVQKVSSQWMFYDDMAYTVPALLSTLTFSSWSDHFNRKYPMIIGPVGLVVSSFAYIGNAMYLDGRLPFILIPAVLLGLTGGVIFTLSACFSYITAITDVKSRTMRIAIVESMGMAGGMVAEFSSGPMLRTLGFIYSYVVIIASGLLIIVYITICIKELPETDIQDGSHIPTEDKCDRTSGIIEKATSHITSNKRDPSVEKVVETTVTNNPERKIPPIIKKLFQLRHLYEGFLVVGKSRRGKLRRRLIVTVGMVCLYWFLSTGAVPLHYLFLRYPPLNWTPTMYGYYSGVQSATMWLGSLLVVPLMSRKFGIHDNTITIIGMVSFMLAELWFGICTHDWMVYTTPFISLFGPGYRVCTKSLLASNVESEELGRLYGLVSLIENITSMISNALYEYILYPATLELFVGFCFILSAVLRLIPLAMACWLYYDLRKDASYVTLEEDLGSDTQDDSQSQNKDMPLQDKNQQSVQSPD